MLESFHDGDLPASRGYLDDGGGQVMVTAVKCHEDTPRDLVVRAVETTGRAATVTLDIPLAGIRLTADFGPSQIRTFRIPRDNPLHAMETDLVEMGLRKGAFTVERT
jgi:alpha-mannosidase